MRRAADRVLPRATRLKRRVTASRRGPGFACRDRLPAAASRPRRPGPAMTGPAGPGLPVSARGLRLEHRGAAGPLGHSGGGIAESGAGDGAGRLSGDCVGLGDGARGGGETSGAGVATSGPTAGSAVVTIGAVSGAGTLAGAGGPGTGASRPSGAGSHHTPPTRARATSVLPIRTRDSIAPGGGSSGSRQGGLCSQKGTLGTEGASARTTDALSGSIEVSLCSDGAPLRMAGTAVRKDPGNRGRLATTPAIARATVEAAGTISRPGRQRRCRIRGGVRSAPDARPCNACRQVAHWARCISISASSVRPSRPATYAEGWPSPVEGVRLEIAP